MSNYTTTSDAVNKTVKITLADGRVLNVREDLAPAYLAADKANAKPATEARTDTVSQSANEAKTETPKTPEANKDTAASDDKKKNNKNGKAEG